LRSLLFSLLLFATLPASGADWQIYTHSLGNQAGMRDGSLRGLPHGGKRAFYVELVRTLLHDLGRTEPIVEVPLARGLKLVQSRAHVVLFNLSRTPEREHLVHWIGPTLQETDYLYELSVRPTGIRTLADAASLPVCVLNGSSHDSLLSEQRFVQLQRANSYTGCFRMLAAGRVLLVASADSDLQSKLAEADVGTAEVTPSAVSLGQDRGYIALSLDTPPAEVERWRAALQQLSRDGRYQRLYSEFAR
jgi:ABC-type amino acid transport substrate-binding protein